MKALTTPDQPDICHWSYPGSTSIRQEACSLAAPSAVEVQRRRRRQVGRREAGRRGAGWWGAGRLRVSRPKRATATVLKEELLLKANRAPPWQHLQKPLVFIRLLLAAMQLLTLPVAVFVAVLVVAPPLQCSRA